jgi:L-asparagine transporter-like permease
MIAAACALGVAFCPTNPSTIEGCSNVFLEADKIRNAFHYAFAALLFLTFAFFSLFLFTKTAISTPTPQKMIRNKIYVACGVIILVSIASILLFTILDSKKNDLARKCEHLHFYF